MCAYAAQTVHWEDEVRIFFTPTTGPAATMCAGLLEKSQCNGCRSFFFFFLYLSIFAATFSAYQTEKFDLNDTLSPLIWCSGRCCPGRQVSTAVPEARAEPFHLCAAVLRRNTARLLVARRRNST